MFIFNAKISENAAFYIKLNEEFGHLKTEPQTSPFSDIL